jgi:nickel-dependent lactate racemase
MELPYGKEKVSFELPRGWVAEVLRPHPVPPAGEVRQSIENPLGDRKLEDFYGATSAAIAISDETRPVPNKVILPILLERLAKMGFSPSQITILIASGLHPPLPPYRFPNILPPDILGKYSVLAHDAKDPNLEFLGNTSRGTPVYVNPFFRQVDLRLVVGLIDPHQFVGYTGGVKCAAVGLAGAQTIEANHSLLFDSKAVVGEIQANPVRQDIEEIGKLMGVHFVINVVLDENNRLGKSFSGNPVEVEFRGSEFCRTVYEINVREEYDIVIASPGGYPKDINVYQAQKGLAHATPLVRQGGDIILVAECPDGHGEEIFYQEMKRYQIPQEVITGFQKEPFRMGAHKAFLWARSLAKAQVHLCSALEETLGHQLMTAPARNLEETLHQLKGKYPHSPKIAIMSKANSTYARIRFEVGR